ncbi:hypothetical protein NC00_14610 [Xanthomonas cannabis pv. phaseoli]|uniref:Uncharacterized protein n=1 Tax=Xanthomonas cannabis pv. phaseoli TaxID=1885902 RepID=A0AB34P6G0_9XANT|nr:hypothetical protein NC00_14610 [Xanthomonas cannabis pv. phaseoli]
MIHAPLCIISVLASDGNNCFRETVAAFLDSINNSSALGICQGTHVLQQFSSAVFSLSRKLALEI